MRATADLSDTELAGYASEHLVYELRMFSRAVGAALGRSGERWPENVCVEELALHLRNLLDFLYPGAGRRAGDVVASDFYVQPDTWSPPPKTPLLMGSHLRAHREVAHLTTDRKSERQEKLWDPAQIAADVLPPVELFAEGADRVDAGFRREASEILAELRTWAGIDDA